MIDLKLFALMTIAAGLGFSQVTDPTAASVVTAQPSPVQPLPPYMVYRHFLGWVNELDKSAVAAKATDPYQFAQPFGRANLQHAHLDILRTEAHRLASDLQQQDAQASEYIVRYRAKAKEALAQSLPLPPLPSELHDLNVQRTAMLIHHYVTLRAALGTDVSAQLDSYLAYEFAPHIKLRQMAAPVLPPSPSAAPTN